MKHILILFVSCFLCSCSSSKNDSATKDSTAQDSIASTRNVDSSQIKTKNLPVAAKDTVTSLDRFPTNWIMLTPGAGSYIIQRYCDAENPSVEIMRTSDGFDLAHNLGQTANLYTVESFMCIRPGKFQIQLKAQYGNEDGTMDRLVTIEYMEDGTGKATWTWFDKGGDTEVLQPAAFTVKEEQGKYPEETAGNCDEM